jgi:branched-chain amino acid transport system permease protein
MLHAILSGDVPRSKVLAVALALIFLALLFAPFVFPTVNAVNVAGKICIFILLAASYDLLLGYTGIVSFAHTMFFGIGAYGVAIAMGRFAPDWSGVLLGGGIAIALSVALAALIGLFSLRVRAIFFAMITLAVASAFAILASQLSTLTGGEDGLNYRVPEMLRPAFRLFDGEVLGIVINGRVMAYYLTFTVSLLLFLLLLRVVNSPFGRVLQAIRENEFRAEAIGYRTVHYRTLANCLAAAVATVAGMLLALVLRYTNPDTTLSFTIMMDILLMVVIGGMGTLYGSVIGATLFLLAQLYLKDVMGAASAATSGVPLLPSLLHPDRWLLWFGLLFIASVYFFPTGIVGRLRSLAQRYRLL